MSWRNSPQFLSCQASPTCSSAGLVDIGTRADHAIRDAEASARAIALWGTVGDWDSVRSSIMAWDGTVTRRRR